MLKRKSRNSQLSKRLSKQRRIRSPKANSVVPETWVQPYTSISPVCTQRVLKQKNWSDLHRRHEPTGPICLKLNRASIELHVRYGEFIKDWEEILKTYPNKLDFSVKREALNQARRIFGRDFYDKGNHYVRFFNALLAGYFFEASYDLGLLDLPYWGREFITISGDIHNLRLSYRYRKLSKRVRVFLGTPLY